MKDETPAGSSPIEWFDHLVIGDIAKVGGKNASLGELTRAMATLGVKVPPGFATTARAYQDFLDTNALSPRIQEKLGGLDLSDVPRLRVAAAGVRQMILEAELPQSLRQAVIAAYQALATDEDPEPAVAVRSSATAEDLPEASFAGQQETFLNVRGASGVLAAIRKAYASLFTDRAIVYRREHGFSDFQVALSAGVQKMVRADIGSAGVAFTVDTESGFDDVVLITAAFGLGETVVQGIVDPDEFFVFKPSVKSGRRGILSRALGKKELKLVYAEPSDGGPETHLVSVPVADQHRFTLADDEIEQLAAQAIKIEQHYGRPMDIEWAKDGIDGELYILQARPETVQSRWDRNVLERYKLNATPAPITSGYAVGRNVGIGRARIVQRPDQLETLQPGEVLVADRTDPDWGPFMGRAAAIVTNHGSRACHAAIVAREMGIPAVVGCGDATTSIDEGSVVTVSCAEGADGHVYAGELDVVVDRVEIDKMPPVPVRLMMNLADPHRAFELARLPNAGVGLARVEFIINSMIGMHPRAAIEWDQLASPLRAEILEKCRGYSDPRTFYVSRLAEGIAMLAAAFAPKPVIVRTSDFKSNEYAHLLGGTAYEPKEENPMLGFRGAARYLSEAFRPCFQLECEAIRYVREEIGLTNVEVMIPFLRTLGEAKAVTSLLAEQGLERGRAGLRLIMMCEIPSNVLLADQFLDYFDGYSIGSNDLTQLTLGVDRDSDLLADLFDERDPAVMSLIHDVIQVCRKRDKYIGICGQGPSDHPDLADWLVKEGIDSLSLNPDTLIDTWLMLGQVREH